MPLQVPSVAECAVCCSGTTIEASRATLQLIAVYMLIGCHRDALQFLERQTRCRSATVALGRVRSVRETLPGVVSGRQKKKKKIARYLYLVRIEYSSKMCGVVSLILDAALHCVAKVFHVIFFI